MDESKQPERRKALTTTVDSIQRNTRLQPRIFDCSLNRGRHILFGQETALNKQKNNKKQTTPASTWKHLGYVMSAQPRALDGGICFEVMLKNLLTSHSLALLLQLHGYHHHYITYNA